MADETVSEQLQRAGWMDLQLSDGSVISMHPSDIMRRREDQKRQREQQFFEALTKAQTAVSPGTVFRSGYQSNATSAWRTLDKPRDTPNFIFLRSMRRQSMIDQLIIDIRVAQVLNVARRSSNPHRQAGWRVRHKYADDPNFTVDESTQRRCLEMESRIEKGLNQAWHPFGLRSLLTQMAEDELVIDRKCIVYDAIDEKGRWHDGWHYVTPECYSDDTEVLTDNGWKRFADVDVNQDRFATRNQETHAFEWQHASALHIHDWDGPLYHFHSQSLDVLVTPNHRMLVNMVPYALTGRGDRAHHPGHEGFVLAGDLARTKNSNTAFPATSSWDAPDLPWFAIPEPDGHAMTLAVFDGNAIRQAREAIGASYATIGRMAGTNAQTIWNAEHGKRLKVNVLSRIESVLGPIEHSCEDQSDYIHGMSGDDFAAFMGMYLAEGCVTETGGRTVAGVRERHTVTISQMPSSKGFIEYRDLVNRIVGREVRHDGRVFSFKCKALAQYLWQFGKTLDKYVPDVVKNMSSRQLAIFWHYYWLGDGWDHRGVQEAATSSIRLAGDLQEILQKMGLSTSISAVHPRRDAHMRDGRVIKAENTHISYRVCVRKTTYQTFSVDEEPYTGKVYCVSVPNETLYVRRNGSPVWCGNSVLPRIDAILPEIERMAVEQAVPMRQIIERQQWVNEATYRASEKANLDLSDKAYVQLVDGQVVSAWTTDECKIDVVHTSSELNRWGFGKSVLESAMWWSLSAMLALNYNTDLFRQNYPEAVMFLFGDVDPIGLDQFKKQVLLDNAAGANWRLPVIPAGEGMKAQVEKLRDAPREMMFAQWVKMLTSYKCAAYRMNPELLNFDLVHGSDQTLFETASNEARVILAREEGFGSLLRSLGDFLTCALVQPWYDDLIFEWVGLDAMTEREEVKMRLDQLQYNTLGEVREASGAVGGLTGADADLLDRILNPTAVALRHQEEQIKLQRQQVAIQRQAMQARSAAGSPAGGPRIAPGAGGEEDPPSAGGRLHRNPPAGGMKPDSAVERADRD